MKKIIAITGAAAVVLVGSAYFSPYLTLSQMKTAIDKHDGAAFSEHVDFPALRESLKEQMIAMINKKIDSAPAQKDNPMAGAAGKAMAAAFITPIIDAAVTPDGVIAMLKAGDAKPGAGGAGKGAEKSPDFSVSHEGWSKVIVRKAGEGKNDGGFVFKRDGLWSWKLAAVELPKAALDGSQ